MQFADIKGQDTAIQIIKQALSNKHLAHGYLFVGPEGVGKKMAALALGQYLNCHHPDTQLVDSCGVCASCLKMHNLEHPDLLLVEPDGATIKIEQIRKLNSKVSLHCYEGAYKIVLINDAHLMTQEAANSLLKTLEEPVSQTLFILITAQAQKLPDTILSRCQSLPFKPIPTAVLATILQQQYPPLQSQLGLTAILARGSAKTAENLLASDALLVARTQLYQLLNQITMKAPSDVLLWSEQWDKDRQMVKSLLELCQTWYRDLLIWNTTAEVTLLFNQDYLDTITSQSVDPFALMATLRLINQSLQQLEYNASPRLVLDVLLLKLNTNQLVG